FVARLPAGQEASCDARESTELAWLKPRAALARAQEGELVLPPPTAFTLFELAAYASIDAVYGAQRHIEPWLPRVAFIDELPCVLLPWDAAYHEAEGEGAAAEPPFEGAPSRITLVDGAWLPS